MGGRGSFSKLGKTIDDVLGVSSDTGKVEEIDTAPFKTLDQTENLIRNKKREVLVVFNENGEAIKAYQGDAKSVAFPVAEAQKWKGCTVTHCHPKGIEGFGGTFSFADMRNATIFEFGSHRACAAGQGEKNYILRTTNKARPMEFNRRIAADIPWLRERMHEEVRNVKKAYHDKTGDFKNYAHALHVARQRSVGFLNRYYRQTAEEYGYVYRTQK